MVGGEDDAVDVPSLRDARVDRKQRRLLEKLEHRIPGLGLRPAFAWGAPWSNAESTPWPDCSRSSGSTEANNSPDKLDHVWVNWCSTKPSSTRIPLATPLGQPTNFFGRNPGSCRIRLRCLCWPRRVCQQVIGQRQQLDHLRVGGSSLG